MNNEETTNNYDNYDNKIKLIWDEINILCKSIKDIKENFETSSVANMIQKLNKILNLYENLGIKLHEIVEIREEQTTKYKNQINKYKTRLLEYDLLPLCNNCGFRGGKEYLEGYERNISNFN